MAKPENFLVACDIGTSKVCILIGEQNAGGALDVIGKGASANRGTRKGNIINVDATIEAIKRAAEEAEIMAGVQISRAWVGLSGSQVRSFNSRGVVAVAGKDRGITKEDVDRVIEAAKSVQIPQDHVVVHSIARDFAVDGQDGIPDPVGMIGSRLEADVLVVTAPVAVTQNVETCMNKAGIEVIELVLEQFAAAEAVLTPDEKELGIGLVDIGGGTTEVAVYQKGTIVHTAVVPIGGDHFTNDLAVVLRAPITDAERLKKKYGCALRSAVGDDEMVEVPMVGGRAPKLCPRSTLADILQPRAEELLGLIHDDLQRLGLDKEIRSGLVLTGGGAELEGVLEIAEGIFEGPVRRGVPAGVGGLVDVVSRPEWATATGLLLYGHRHKPSRRRARAFFQAANSVSRFIRDFF
ncbi:MAG TPA: cell division protein FtsA [Thermoanaerobaculia bacterium]|jgi:cell division protein FtsA|nr:cell division protein FtsA [Thermoanaerobaculia bacterium]